jgi:hypothetical protein
VRVAVTAREGGLISVHYMHPLLRLGASKGRSSSANIVPRESATSGAYASRHA